jgi:tetratricopeptide (TPR) repeat protein
MKHLKKFLLCLYLFLVAWTVQVFSQSAPNRDPELIRDTDVADQTEKAPEAKPKERNPLLANKNINIGNQYLKQKNYIAAISRYMEALEYQPDSISACQALGNAYEKNGDISKALELYTKFVKDNPDSPKILEFRAKIDQISKRSNP